MEVLQSSPPNLRQIPHYLQNETQPDLESGIEPKQNAKYEDPKQSSMITFKGLESVSGQFIRRDVSDETDEAMVTETPTERSQTLES